MFDFKRLLLSLLPETPILQPKEQGGLDLWLDGFADVFTSVYLNLKSYRSIFSARATEFLDLLEREHGITPNPSLSDAFRRNFLHSISEKVLQYGSTSNINEALSDAGFLDLQVFNNNLVVDPSTLATASYLCYLGDTNAYIGEPTAMCSEIQLFWMVYDLKDYSDYAVPSNERLWPYIFFLARAKYDWPIVTVYLADLYKAGNIILYHDYRHESYQDYSGNGNDGIPSSSITVDDTGALLSNLANEKITVAGNNDFSFSQHDFSAIVKIDGTYHDSDISFAALLDQSGSHNIPASITINSIPKTPILRYSGRGATAESIAPWTYGETLEDGGTPFTDLDKGCPGLGYYDLAFGVTSGGYVADNATFADIATEDIVIVMKIKMGNSGTLFSKYNGADGYSMSVVSNKLRFYINDASGGVSFDSATLVTGEWYNVSIYVDRSGYGAFYVNGALSGTPVDISARALTLTNAEYFTLGDIIGGGSPFSGDIAYIDMRIHDAWLDTHLQATLAVELHHRDCGIYPQHYDGSLPTITATNEACYLEKFNGSEYELHRVSDNWLRYEQIEDSIGAINGIRIEKATTNLIDYSYDFSTWGVYRCSASVETEENPLLESLCYSLIPASGTGVSYVTRTIAISVPGNASWSVWVKPGTKDWVKLYFDNGYGTYPRAWFNVTTGERGSTVDCDSRIKGPYNNGFYRVSMSSENSNAAPVMHIIPVDDNDDDECTGNGSDKALYVWGAQAEDLDCETSYIATNGATQSRIKDSLLYNSASIIDSDYSMSVSLSIVNQKLGDALTWYDIRNVCTLKGSSGNTICTVDRQNLGALQYSYSDAVSVVTGTESVRDGDRKNIIFNSATQNGKLSLDSSIDIDVSDVTDPYTDHDTINIGGSATDSNKFGGLIKNVLIHKEQRDNQFIGQPILDNRISHNDGWAISVLGQKVILKLLDQFCSVGDFVDDAITTVGFSIDSESKIDVYVDGYLATQGSRLYNAKTLTSNYGLTIGNSNLYSNQLSFDGLFATVILLDCVLTDAMMLSIYTSSTSIDYDYYIEPGTVAENQLDRLKKVILSRKPLGTWCLAFLNLA